MEEKRNNSIEGLTNNTNESINKQKKEIYVFYSEEEPGIKFYDKTPEREFQETIRDYPDGMYVTDKSSIEQNIVWDSKINNPDNKDIVSLDGETISTTYMVSLQQFQKINKDIKSNSNKEVIIDTRDMTKLFSHKDIAYTDKDYKISNSEIEDVVSIIKGMEKTYETNKELTNGKDLFDEER